MPINIEMTNAATSGDDESDQDVVHEGLRMMSNTSPKRKQALKSS